MPTYRVTFASPSGPEYRFTLEETTRAGAIRRAQSLVPTNPRYVLTAVETLL